MTMMKDNIQVVTSFGPDGFEQYGKAFIESYVKYCDVPLVVYYEIQKPAISHPLITYRDLFSVPRSREFIDAVGKLPIFGGIINGERNYRYDIAKFSRKVFVQWDAARFHGGKLFWIDADVEFLAKLPSTFLSNMLDDVFMVWMGRSNSHSCASFLGWNNQHPDAQRFWQAYYDTLITGQIFVQREWHDSYYIDVVRETLKVSSRNLSGQLRFGSKPGNVFDEVFHGYATHKKGNLKFRHGPARYSSLLQLIRQVQPRHIMEIGTWNGGRAVEMVRASLGATYYGFDLFEAASPLTDAAEKCIKKHYTVESVHKMLSSQGIPNHLYKGNTRETLTRFSEGRKPFLDFCYIHGGHSVETIQSDWEYVRKLMIPGSIVVFDDYYDDVPISELEKYGSNKVLKNLPYQVLPTADPIAGGGVTRLAVVQVTGDLLNTPVNAGERMSVRTNPIAEVRI